VTDTDTDPLDPTGWLAELPVPCDAVPSDKDIATGWHARGVRFDSV